MIRFTKFLAVASALLVLPSTALALGIDIVNVSGAGASGVLLPGETVTFETPTGRTMLSTVTSDITPQPSSMQCQFVSLLNHGLHGLKAQHICKRFKIILIGSKFRV